jgi:glycosyltransferase involved in cell wall biosynthesis
VRRRLRDTGGKAVRLAVYSDAPTVGGAETSLAYLLGELSPRFEVIVIAVSSRVATHVANRRPDADVRVVPAVKHRFDVLPMLAHLWILWRLRPRFVHANLWVPTAARYALAAAILTRGVQTVAVEHLPYPSAGPRQRWFKRVLAATLASHVAVGTRVAAEIAQEYGLDAGRIRVIHNGVPPVTTAAVPRVSAGPAIGSVGRLATQKAYDAIVRLLGRLPDVTAILVGDGPEADALESLATQLGVADRLVITGWVDDPQAYLAAMDVFVLPSRFEGLPLAVLEAMRAGRAVVATDVGSVGEAVEHGATGLLVPPGDEDALATAVSSLLRDRELREAMGGRARDVAAERFSSTRMARDFEALYVELGA